MFDKQYVRGYAACAHRKQVRKYTGEPYYNHLAEVGQILSNFHMPAMVIQAGILHDILEDTDVTEADLRKEFGDALTELVLEVTDIAKPEDGNRTVRKQIEREHLAKTSGWGANIKLADLISNTKSIVTHDPKFAKIYLAEKEKILPLLKHGDPELHALATFHLIKAKAELSL